MSETTTSVQSSPEIAPVRESLDTLAAQKHSAFAAKINGPIFGKERHLLQEQYDQAEHAYINAVRVDVLEQVDGIEFESIDKKIDHFELSINERIAQDREAQKNELISQGGKRAEFLTWYANLSKKKKLSATVGLAAGGAAAAALMSFVGAGAATAAAGLGAYRLARGYNMRASKLYEEPKELPTYTADRETFNDESIDRAMAFIRKDSQLTIERAEKIKKGAALGALGAVALGSSVQIILDETSLGDSIKEKAGQWADKLSTLFIPTAHATESSHVLKTPDEVIETRQDINDNLSGRTAHEYRLHATPEVTAPAGPSGIAESFTVEKGHGYTHELIQTVHDTYGVELSKQEAWELHKELVRTAGSDYIELLDHSGADVYSMGGSSYEVGLSAGGEAQWSDKAIRLLDEKYTDNDVSVPEKDATTATPETPTNNTKVTDAPLTLDDPVEDDIPRGLMDDATQPEQPSGTPATGGTDELLGLTEAHKAQIEGLDGISWQDMKADAQQMRELFRSGDVAAINDGYMFQNTLEYIQKDIGSMTYPGTDVQIIERQGNEFGDMWVVNEIPEGSNMPSSVINTFDAYVKSLLKLAP